MWARVLMTGSMKCLCNFEFFNCEFYSTGLCVTGAKELYWSAKVVKADFGMIASLCHESTCISSISVSAADAARKSVADFNEGFCCFDGVPGTHFMVAQSIYT